jgi:hypothetical protein
MDLREVYYEVLREPIAWPSAAGTVTAVHAPTGTHASIGYDDSCNVSQGLAALLARSNLAQIVNRLKAAEDSVE